MASGTDRRISAHGDGGGNKIEAKRMKTTHQVRADGRMALARALCLWSGSDRHAIEIPNHELAGHSAAMIPVILSMFGLGMVAGNVIGGRMADKNLEKTIRYLLLWSILIMCVYVFTSHYAWPGAITVMLIGTMVSLSSVLQIRLMDVAGDAQTTAAALNHSAFNTANALGSWLGSLTITAELGWSSTGRVVAVLALTGLALHFWAVSDTRRSARIAC